MTVAKAVAIAVVEVVNLAGSAGIVAMLTAEYICSLIDKLNLQKKLKK